MAHRGRLNVMAHVLNKPYAQILAEFKEPVSSRSVPRRHGVDRRRQVPRRRAPRDQGRRGDGLVVSMPPNPSHLEAVDPVVEGMARAAGTIVDAAGAPTFDPDAQRADPDSRRRGVPRPGRRRRDAEPGAAARLQHRRHDPHHRQQPARVHRPARASRTARRTRAAWRADSRFRSSTSTPTIPRRCVEAARLAFAYRARVPARLPDRSDRLPPLRPQRGRRAGVHAAADVPEDRVASDRPRDLGAARWSSAARSTPGAAEALVAEAHRTSCRASMDALQPEQDFVEPQPETPPPGAAAQGARPPCRSSSCAS